METRALGATGQHSTVLIYGGAALSDVSPQEADRSIRFALDAGINHFDTAAAYGSSEVHLGRWMPRIRDRVFLSTKTGDRAAGAAYASIRRSLGRLQVDHVDLIQLHDVRLGEDLDRATKAGGALDAAVRAREEGLARSVGITGHGMRAPAMHLEALRRFPFETVIVPYNFHLATDETYRRDLDMLLEETSKRGVGVMVIKAIARRLWKQDERRAYRTWYEPLDDPPTIDAAVAFVLSRPEITGICSAADPRLLPLLVRAVERRDALAETVMRERLSAAADVASPFVPAPGRVFPDWLEPASR